jgi:hypothetical protein
VSTETRGMRVLDGLNRHGYSTVRDARKGEGTFQHTTLVGDISQGYVLRVIALTKPEIKWI